MTGIKVGCVDKKKEEKARKREEIVNKRILQYLLIFTGR